MKTLSLNSIPSQRTSLCGPEPCSAGFVCKGLSSKHLKTFLCIHTHVHMCSWCLEKPEESAGSPGVGSHVRVRCEPSNIGAGNQTQPLEEQQVLSITEPSDQMTGWGVWGWGG